MAVTALGKMKENIRLNLAMLTTLVKLNTAIGHTDINHEAEDFYCGLLNKAFGWNLVNQNALQMNFPAIDLGDPDAVLPDGKKGIAVQVTSTEGRTKVQNTLDKFFENNQDHTFKRLIVLIIGEKPAYRDFKLKRSFGFDKSEDIWDTAELMRKLDSLAEERLKAVDDYLQQQLPFHRAKTRIMELPLVSAMTAEGFVGREKELAQISAEMENGTKPIFISGLGGMGKTELAVRFCKNYNQGNAYMVTFQESFRKTLVLNVAAGIPGLLEQKLQEEDIYARVLHHLGRLDEKDILLIDNADGDGSNFSKLEDEAYRELKKLPMHLIVTTRCSVAGAVKADALKQEQLRSLFDLYEVNISPEDRDSLIHTVNSHTMTVDLMARTMADGFMTAAQMRNAMETGVLDEDFDAIGTYHDPDSPQKRIDAHLLTLFRASEMGEDAKKVLSCAILLPQGGMDIDVFRNALPEGIASALKDLTKRGWLKFDHGTRLLTIHPVIKLVCRIDLQDWKAVCPEFLTRLHEQQDAKEFKLDVYRQLAEVYIAAVEAQVSTDRAMWHYLSAWYLWTQGQYQEALNYEQEVLRRRKEVLADNDSDLAHVYNDIGTLYGLLGDLNKALEYYEKALEIRKAALPENHPDLATSYDNMGGAYGSLGEHQTALEHFNTAMGIRKKALPENHPDIACSYDNLGTAYSHLGQYKTSLAHHTTALEIRKKALPENHPDIARSYDNLGVAYSHLDQHQTSLEHCLTALEIRKAVLPPNHPDIADSLYNIAVTHYNLAMEIKAGYFRKKGMQTALKYAQEALKVAQNTPTGSHLLMSEIEQLVKDLKRLSK